MSNLDVKYDINSMNSLLLNFHNQIEHACELGNEIKEINFDTKPKEMIILGMGGSAIGGDLLKGIIHQLTNDRFRIGINRSYDVPDYINNQTLVVASSYSGNTEETLTGFEKASKLTNKLFAITSGGKLEKICKERDIPYLKLPAGFQPRAAIAYSFFGLLYLCVNNNLVGDDFNKSIRLSVNELSVTMKKLTERYSSHEITNPAFKLANNLFGQIPIIYSSVGMLEAVNMRWKGQFNENSKSLCFGNFIPEMNHNEISGWVIPKDMISRFRIILLRDKAVNPRIRVRLDAVKEIFKGMDLQVDEFYGIGEHFLTRIFDLIHLGDWTSYYLAILNKQDPIAIPLIMKLKEVLNKTKTEGSIV
jgi:glucose/mannose-6-phosphate isomerase